MPTQDQAPLSRAFTTLGLAFESGELSDKLKRLGDSPPREAIRVLDYLGKLGEVGRFRAEAQLDPVNDPADYMALCQSAAPPICKLLSSPAQDVHTAAKETLRRLHVKGTAQGEFTIEPLNG